MLLTPTVSGLDVEMSSFWALDDDIADDDDAIDQQPQTPREHGSNSQPAGAAAAAAAEAGIATATAAAEDEIATLSRMEQELGLEPLASHTLSLDLPEQPAAAASDSSGQSASALASPATEATEATSVAAAAAEPAAGKAGASGKAGAASASDNAFDELERFLANIDVKDAALVPEI